MAAQADAARVYEHGDEAAHEHDDNNEDDEAEAAHGLLAGELFVGFGHLTSLALAFEGQGGVLYAVDLVHVDKAGFEFDRLLAVVEGRAIVADATIHVAVEAVDVGEVFVAFDIGSHASAFVEVVFSLGEVALFVPDAGESDERVEGVPVVAEVLHDGVGLLVLVQCAVVVEFFAVHVAEVSVAERDAEFVAVAHVEVHGASVVVPGAVGDVALMENSTDVGAVDGLTGEAAESGLAGECESEDAVGAVEVADR